MTNYPSRSSSAVLDAPAGLANTSYAPRWMQLAARLFATSLDAKLAAGESPLASHLLAIRAQQLATPSYRDTIAQAWRALLSDARRPRSLFDPAVPLVRESILAAQSEVRAVTEALAAPIAAVRGIALAVVTLRDGAGPLFNPSSPVGVRQRCNDLLVQLDPLSQATSH